MDVPASELKVNTKDSRFRQMFSKVYCLRYEWPDVFEWLKNYEHYLKMFQMVEENLDTPMYSSTWNERKERHLRDPLFGQELTRIYQDRRLLEFLARPPFFREINLQDQDREDDAILRLCIYWTGITGAIAEIPTSSKATLVTQAAQPSIYPSAISQRLEYDDFDLVIESSPETDTNLVRATAPSGEMQESAEFDWHEIVGLWHRLQLFLREQSDPDLVRTLGGRLFATLFPGQVEALFRTALSNSRAKARGLRVHLRLESGPLFELPWEYVYDNAEDQYLAISPELPLSRYLQVSSFVRDLRVRPPIKILFIAPTPVNLFPLDFETELGMISEALANLTASGVVQLDVVTKGTLANLRQRLRETYHIIHFSGHGAFYQDHLGLSFVDEADKMRFVTDDEFKELFLGNRTLRLIVLSACAGTPEGREESDKAILGIAPKLVQRGIPAVLVMQSNITDVAATVFARELYQALATNFALDVAVAEARRAIRLDVPDRPEWGIPILYMQSRDGRIFDIEESLIKPVDLARPLQTVRESVSASPVREDQQESPET